MLGVGLGEGRGALRGSVEGFLTAVSGLGELDLLAASRCHGWARLDVVTHVLGGWQELLGGLARPTDARPDVDAATYWTAWTAGHAADDPVEQLMWQRRRTAAYRRPAHAVAELRDVAAVLDDALLALDERPRSFQGHVLAPGDLAATWAVENAVHQLDLDVAQPPPEDGLRLARRTVEAIAGEALPAAWDDVRAVLAGTGRVPVPPDAGPAGPRLPALG